LNLIEGFEMDSIDFVITRNFVQVSLEKTDFKKEA